MLFTHRYPPLVAGTLLGRRQRFLADVELAGSGRRVVAHTNNTGSMLGCSTPGSAVYLSRAPAGSGRRTRFTWQAVRVGRIWVAIDTLLPNRLLAAAIAARRLPELAGYATLRREVRYGEGSRVDLLLEDPRRGRCFVEIKNVTLAESSVARFPDAVTARGLKHLEQLSAVVAGGERAVALFFVPRADCTSFAPAAAIDPAYAAGLRRAAAAGGEVLAYRARVRRDAVRLEMRLPVQV